MPDSRELAKLTVEHDARAFLIERGGHVWVWADSAGLSCSSIRQPDRDEEWIERTANGVTWHLAESAAAATSWYVRLRRFPRRRIDVTSNLGGWSGQLQSGTTIL